MAKYISVVLLLLKTFGVQGQQGELDSLMQLLNRYQHHDTTRIDLLNDIAYTYHTVDPDKGLQTADSAIVLARELSPGRRIASAYANKGVNYWAKGEDSLAIIMYQNALKIHEANQNKTGMGNMYNNIGLLYFNKSAFYDALTWHQKALDMFIQINDSVRISTVHNNIGVDYQYISDYPKALEHYFRALAIHEQKQGAHLTGNAEVQVLSNIGIVYRILGQYDSALVYQNRAMETYRSTGNKQGMASTYGNIGIIYDLLSEPEEAVSQYLKGLQLNEELGNQRLMASNYTNLGLAYIQLGDYEKSYGYLQKAKSFYERTEDKNNLTITLLNLGNLYLNAPVEFLKKHQIEGNNRYLAATGAVLQALNISREIKVLALQSTVLENLSEVYEKAGFPSKALAAYKEHIQLRDSILGEEKRIEIAQKIATLEYEKKAIVLQAEHAKNTALAKAEVQRQRIIRNTVAVGGILLLLAAVGMYISYKRRRDAESRKKDMEFKARVVETEMKALRAQMNPHFIFNSLNSIADFISKNEIPVAERYLTKFAQLIRLILENSEKKEVPLANDLKALEWYVQLESLRLNHKFEYKVTVSENTDPDNTLVPPLLLQPFVENSIWHGMTRSDSNGLIEIKIGTDNDTLTCIVEDNGVGRNYSHANPPDEPEHKKSLGMKITSERIELLNQLKQANASLSVFDLTRGLRIELRLPLQTAF